MKRALAGIVALAAVLASFLVGDALRLRPAPRGGPPLVPAADIDASAVAAHLAEAIRFKTVSHQDPAQDDASEIAAFRLFLVRTYPLLHRTLAQEDVGARGLLYTWEGEDRNALPVLLMAHADVVPVEPATSSSWTHPPFEGAVDAGFVWGRGALDDKGSLIGLCEAVESLIARGFVPRRTVYLTFGFDEEVGGREGAAQIAALLKKRGVRLSWVLDEGGGVSEGIFAGVDRPITGIAVGEKGYLSVELVAKGEGGHSSTPPHPTAIGRLARALARLEERQLAPRLVEPWRTALRTLAPEMGFAKRLALSNLWLFSPFVARSLASSTPTNPMVRTTTAATILEAGVKENVLPSSARAVVNFRLLPGDRTASVLAHVRGVVDDEEVSATALTRTMIEPAPVSSTDRDGYRLLEAAARRAYPDTVVVPSMVNGATDSRHFAPLADDVYRFVPRLLKAEDLKRVHGVDERMEVVDLAREVQIYREILESAAGRAPK